MVSNQIIPFMELKKEIRIIEQGSHDARMISKAMSSATASDLLDAISERPMSATELEAQTGYPLPTIQYHMGNLLTAGLVQVSKIRYSEKGKPMKLYAASDTILVISPKKKTEEEVKPVLRKYGITAAGLVVGAITVAGVCANAAQMVADSTVIAGTGEKVAYKLTSPLNDELANPATIPAPDAFSENMVVFTPENTMYAAAAPVLGSGSVTTDVILSQIQMGLLIFLLTSAAIVAVFLIFELLRIKKRKEEQYED